jgi:hypothetical protein
MDGWISLSLETKFKCLTSHSWFLWTRVLELLSIALKLERATSAELFMFLEFFLNVAITQLAIHCEARPVLALAEMLAVE